MLGAEQGEDTGRFVTTHPDDAVVKAISDAGGTATTQEAVDAIGSRRETAYKKLVRLEDAGRVGSRESRQCALWSVADVQEGKRGPWTDQNRRKE